MQETTKVQNHNEQVIREWVEELSAGILTAKRHDLPTMFSSHPAISVYRADGQPLSPAGDDLSAGRPISGQSYDDPSPYRRLDRRHTKARDEVRIWVQQIAEEYLTEAESERAYRASFGWS